MGRGGNLILRLGVVVATIAAVLVPAWVAPARTISVPITVADTIELSDVAVRRARGLRSLAFAPTHIAFSWSGSEDVTIHYRAHDGTLWLEAPIAHDADTPTKHFTGVIAVDRPRALEWKVVAGPGASVSDVTLDYLNTVDGPRVTRELPAVASAAARAPNIVTRAEWGADESLKRTGGGCKRQFHPVKQLFVHHTAGANFDRNPKATMRAIYWYHVVRQGWCDIGYNFVISYDGRIFEGRWARDYKPWEMHDSENRQNEVVSGAHVDGFNSGTVGISVMGNFQSARPSPATRQALAELLAWEVDRHDLSARGRHVYRNPETGATTKLPWIAGHRDADSTSCPGDRLYAVLPDVRRDAAAVIGAGKTSTSVEATASASKIAYGEEVTIAGTLTDVDGRPLDSRPIRTYVREGDQAWVAGPSATTAADGTFALTLRPSANVKVATIYDGDDATWGSETEVTVKVAPLVTLSAEGSTADASGVHHYPAGTSEVVFTGTVAPPHPGRSVQVFVSKLQPDGRFVRVDSGSVEVNRTGDFSFTWSVVDPGVGGTYHARAVFPKDDDHARASSAPVTFVIDPQP